MTPSTSSRTGSAAAAPGSIAARLRLAPEVAEALASGRPVVALESTLISHGLPYPENVTVARASEAAVRDAGAVPATVAVRNGEILVGLDDAALEALGTAPAGSVRKVARPSLAPALAAGGWAATTVSATMIAAHTAGIAVFATGGIGGVHRGALGFGGGGSGAGPGGQAGAAPTFDISADLDELARTPVAVICAGPKAILDVPATLEYLETHGVPVVAIGQDELPGFYSRTSGIRAPFSVADEAEAAELIRTHLRLGLGAGILLCTPAPADVALPEDVARNAIEQAIADADRASISGPALTPWLLARIAVLTAGASVRANTALIVHDAAVAGRLARALATG